MALGAPEVVVGLIVLFAACLPLGAVLLRGIERAAGRRFGFTAPERMLLSLYAAGGLLYALVSVPLPLYYPETPVVLFAAGAAAYGALAWRDRGRSLAPALRWGTSLPGAVVALGTLALLALEVGTSGMHSLPNPYDGAYQALLAHLILAHHSAPATLAPYASVGVTYPLGTAVWLTLPTALYGWPVATSPLTVPLLFLSLSLVAAYAWGERLGGVGSGRGQQVGLVFAALFGLVASWPRLFVGGSYDFAIAIPLFLVALGLVPAFAKQRVPRWSLAAAYGLVVGVSAALSVAVGEMLVLVAAASVIVYAPSLRRQGARWFASLVVVVVVAGGWVARSLVGAAFWWRYPGHTLSPVGAMPYAPSPSLSQLLSPSFVGNLDPFILWKPKLSPIPALSLETEVLLVIGLAMLVAGLVVPRRDVRRALEREIAIAVGLPTTVAFLFTAALLLLEPTVAGGLLVNGISSYYESSFLLFIGFQAIASLPILFLVATVRRQWIRPADPPRADAPASVPEQRPLRPRRRPARVGARGTVAIVLLLVTFGFGAGATAVSAPAYLSGHIEQFANVSSGDLAALAWSGNHLPSCSTVLVAPGSVGQFLPLYAGVHLTFPMVPYPFNYSYYLAVANLTAGVYTPATRSALIALGITEVFVSGQTSVSYRPFSTTPLRQSADFSELFEEEDASIFAFVPVEESSGCTAS
jgi:hypothetical protein